MYSIDWTALVRRRRGQDATAAPLTRVIGRTVWALGVTSLLTDISSEMIASILPLYLVLQLGMQPLAFGFIDGVYQGGAALVRIAAGAMADRLRRYKAVAVTGYALSACCRIALLAAGSNWSIITGTVAVDRLGKGVRTAPRDALIALSTDRAYLATAFGVHRALDAGGAMLGPLLAFALLASAPARYDILFAVSFAVAIAGLSAIILFVEPASMTPAATALNPPRGRIRDVFRDARFRGLLIVGFLLAVATVSDAFIYLALQRRLAIGATAFPLLYVGTSTLNAMFSIPAGRLADRWGRRAVFLCGYGALAAVYVILLLPAGSGLVVVLPLALLGLYYAATDGVLTALAASVLPPEAAGTGLSLLATATNGGKLLSSILFGLLWARADLRTATIRYLIALMVALPVSAAILAATRPAPPIAPRV